MQEELKNKIKQIHKIPPGDLLDIETEVFLDYFAKELLDFIKANRDRLDD